MNMPAIAHTLFHRDEDKDLAMVYVGDSTAICHKCYRALVHKIITDKTEPSSHITGDGVWDYFHYNPSTTEFYLFCPSCDPNPELFTDREDFFYIFEE